MFIKESHGVHRWITILCCHNILNCNHPNLICRIIFWKVAFVCFMQHNYRAQSAFIKTTSITNVNMVYSYFTRSIGRFFVLWTPHVHHCIHKIIPLNPILAGWIHPIISALLLQSWYCWHWIQCSATQFTTFSSLQTSKDSVDNCCNVSQPTCHNILNLNAAKHFSSVLAPTAKFYSPL